MHMTVVCKDPRCPAQGATRPSYCAPRDWQKHRKSGVTARLLPVRPIIAAIINQKRERGWRARPSHCFIPPPVRTAHREIAPRQM